jgi:hypothetical protein
MFKFKSPPVEEWPTQYEAPIEPSKRFHAPSLAIGLTFGLLVFLGFKALYDVTIHPWGNARVPNCERNIH